MMKTVECPECGNRNAATHDSDGFSCPECHRVFVPGEEVLNQLALPCKKLHEVPSVVTDWEQRVWCPDCEHYYLGACLNPSRTSPSSPCPFDGKALPLSEIAGGLDKDRPQDPKAGVRSREPEGPGRSAELEEAITHEIGQRTGGRIHALEVEVIDDRVVLRGCAASYYLKQLALQGVLAVLGSAGAARIELDIQVLGNPPNLGE